MYLSLAELLIEDEHMVELVETLSIHAHKAEKFGLNLVILALHDANSIRENLFQVA